MESKRGRKSVYDAKIKSRFPEIAEWVKNGATEKSIMKNLGVSHTTWTKYKNEKPELMELLNKNRALAVNEIENSMYLSALGGKQTVWKGMKVKKTEYENGKKVLEFETVEKYQEEVYVPPNTTAGIYLLKHWGRNRGYTNDPLTLELKKEELELKKEIAEDNNW